MLLAVINGKPEVFTDFDEFYEATWSPENEYTFLTDFLIHGNKYSERKESARDLAQSIQMASSNGSLTYSELADIGAAMEKIARCYGLVREFKENGII